MRATASLASSTPAPSPRQPSGKSKKTKATKRSKSKADMAGLVGGDSDSSALTQESGDEGAAVTPRDSVITGTDAGTDSEEDHPDVQEASPGKVVFLSPYSRLICSGQSKATRGRVKQLARGGAVPRTRAGSMSNARGTKKRKK
jgi:MRG-binding protein